MTVSEYVQSSSLLWVTVVAAAAGTCTMEKGALVMAGAIMPWLLNGKRAWSSHVWAAVLFAASVWCMFSHRASSQTAAQAVAAFACSWAVSFTPWEAMLEHLEQRPDAAYRGMCSSFKLMLARGMAKTIKTAGLAPLALKIAAATGHVRPRQVLAAALCCFGVFEVARIVMAAVRSTPVALGPLEALLMLGSAFLVGRDESWSALQAVVKEGASRLAAMQRRQKMMEAEKEVLQAELEAVLGPAAQVETGSPADLILNMVSDMLEGQVPSKEALLLVRSCILSARDDTQLYTPLNLDNQLHAMMEPEIEEALLYQLFGVSRLAQSVTAEEQGDVAGCAPAHALAKDGGRSAPSHAAAPGEARTGSHFSSLRAALSVLACDASPLDGGLTATANSGPGGVPVARLQSIPRHKGDPAASRAKNLSARSLQQQVAAANASNGSAAPYSALSNAHMSAGYKCVTGSIPSLHSSSTGMGGAGFGIASAVAAELGPASHADSQLSRNSSADGPTPSFPPLTLAPGLDATLIKRHSGPVVTPDSTSLALPMLQPGPSCSQGDQGRSAASGGCMDIQRMLRQASVQQQTGVQLAAAPPLSPPRSPVYDQALIASQTLSGVPGAASSLSPAGPALWGAGAGAACTLGSHQRVLHRPIAAFLNAAQGSSGAVSSTAGRPGHVPTNSYLRSKTTGAFHDMDALSIFPASPEPERQLDPLLDTDEAAEQLLAVARANSNMAPITRLGRALTSVMHNKRAPTSSSPQVSLPLDVVGAGAAATPKSEGVAASSSERGTAGCSTGSASQGRPTPSNNQQLPTPSDHRVNNNAEDADGGMGAAGRQGTLSSRRGDQVTRRVGEWMPLPANKAATTTLEQPFGSLGSELLMLGHTPLTTMGMEAGGVNGDALSMEPPHRERSSGMESLGLFNRTRTSGGLQPSNASTQMQGPQEPTLTRTGEAAAGATTCASAYKPRVISNVAYRSSHTDPQLFVPHAAGSPPLTEAHAPESVTGRVQTLASAGVEVEPCARRVVPAATSPQLWSLQALGAGKGRDGKDDVEGLGQERQAKGDGSSLASAPSVSLAPGPSFQSQVSNVSTVTADEVPSPTGTQRKKSTKASKVLKSLLRLGPSKQSSTGRSSPTASLRSSQTDSPHGPAVASHLLLPLPPKVGAGATAHHTSSQDSGLVKPDQGSRHGAMTGAQGKLKKAPSASNILSAFKRMVTGTGGSSSRRGSVSGAAAAQRPSMPGQPERPSAQAGHSQALLNTHASIKAGGQSQSGLNMDSVLGTSVAAAAAHSGPLNPASTPTSTISGDFDFQGAHLRKLHKASGRKSRGSNNTTGLNTQGSNGSRLSGSSSVVLSPTGEPLRAVGHGLVASTSSSAAQQTQMATISSSLPQAIQVLPDVVPHSAVSTTQDFLQPSSPSRAELNPGQVAEPSGGGRGGSGAGLAGALCALSQHRSWGPQWLVHSSDISSCDTLSKPSLELDLSKQAHHDPHTHSSSRFSIEATRQHQVHHASGPNAISGSVPSMEQAVEGGQTRAQSFSAATSSDAAYVASRLRHSSAIGMADTDSGSISSVVVPVMRPRRQLGSPITAHTQHGSQDLPHSSQQCWSKHVLFTNRSSGCDDIDHASTITPPSASTGDLAHSSSALNSSLGKSHNGVVCSHTMLGPAFHLSSATSLTQQQPEPVGGREISSEGSASWSTPHLQTSGGLGQWMHRMAQNIINSANSFNQGHAQRPQGGSINLKDVTQRSASTQGVTPHVSFASSLGEDTGSLAPSLGANGGVGSCRLARQHNEHAQHVAPYPMQRQESAAQLTMKPASGNLLTQDGLQAVHVIAVPQAPMLDEVEKVLGGAWTSYEFDSFELARVTQGHPLSTLAYYLIHESGLVAGLNLHPVRLARFLRRVEAGYKPNPYHNATHAADVVQTYHVILHAGGLVPHYADSHMLLACYLAAVVHDFEHGGLTNDFLVNSGDPLAIRYNDRAPLENHHLAAAFTLLRMPDLNFVGALSKPEYDKLRKTVIEMVLGTDMKQHFALAGHFNQVRRVVVRPGSPSDARDSRDRDTRGSNVSSGLSLGVPQERSSGPAHYSVKLLRNALESRTLANCSMASGPVGPCSRDVYAARMSSDQHILDGLSNGLRQRVSMPVRPTSLNGTTLSPAPALEGGRAVGGLSSLVRRMRNASGVWGGEGPVTDGDAKGSRSGSDSNHTLGGIGAGIGRLSLARPKSLGWPGTTVLLPRRPRSSGQTLGDNCVGNGAGGGGSTAPNPTLLSSEVSIDTELLDRAAQVIAVQDHPLMPLDETERLLSLQVALKCADIGHVAESREVHLRWVSCLEEEFYRQGDAEKAAGLPVSPLFDRDKPGVTKSQMGFLDVVVLPLYRSLVSSFPGTAPLLVLVKQNYTYWKCVHDGTASAVPTQPTETSLSAREAATDSGMVDTNGEASAEL